MAELNSTAFLNDSDLKAYYRFESGALTTDTKNSHTLTGISDPAENTGGKYHGAVTLDGNDAYSAVDHADFQPAGNFTLTFWFRSATTGASQVIFQSFSANTAFAGFRAYITTGNKLRLDIGKNTGTTPTTDYQTIVGSTTVTDNAWRMGAIVWDGTNLNLYLNGQSDATTVAAFDAVYAATNYVRIGCGNNTGSNANFLTGSLDDISLFDRALSQSEIVNLHAEKEKYFSITDTHATASIAVRNGENKMRHYITGITVSSDKAGSIAVIKTGTTAIWQKQVGVNVVSEQFVYPLVGNENSLISVEIDSTSKGAANIIGYTLPKAGKY